MDPNAMIGPGRPCISCGEVYGLHATTCPNRIEYCGHGYVVDKCQTCRIDQIEKRLREVEERLG